MPPKENSEMSCGECIHYFACSMQCGEQMAQRSATGCECYETVKSIAAARLIERLTAERDVSTLNGRTVLNTLGLGTIRPEDIGKTVFLSREEAEKDLQEMEGKKDG